MAVPTLRKTDDEYWLGIKSPPPLTAPAASNTSRLGVGSLAPLSTPHNSACRSERLDIYANDFNCHLTKAVLSVSAPEYDRWLDEERYIKDKLAHELALYMINNNLVSFTKTNGPHMDTVDYIARAVLMQKDNVDTIRKMVP